MLGDDEDVFDSVTWESPSAPVYDIDDPITPSGPGFRQSTVGANDDPLQPKWEGYLITSVKDPVKELAETKDAYVSYLVQAKVLPLPSHFLLRSFVLPRPTFQYSLLPTLQHGVASKTLCF